MPVFAMQGNQEKKIHGTHYTGDVEIRAHVHVSGPQPVSALPEWLTKLFDEEPSVKRVLIDTEGGGVLYTRMEQE